MTDYPPWVLSAQRMKMQMEVKGPRQNPLILRMAQKLAVKDFQDDEDPWCTLFISYHLAINLPGIELPKHTMWSRAYAKWGVELTEPVPGAIMVYWRGKSPADDIGHAGFWLKPGLTKGWSTIIAGNSRDMVREHQMHDDEFLVSIRWPANYPVPRRPE